MNDETMTRGKTDGQNFSLTIHFHIRIVVIVIVDVIIVFTIINSIAYFTRHALNMQRKKFLNNKLYHIINKCKEFKETIIPPNTSGIKLCIY